MIFCRKLLQLSVTNTKDEEQEKKTSAEESIWYVYSQSSGIMGLWKSNQVHTETFSRGGLLASSSNNGQKTRDKDVLVEALQQYAC